MDACHGTRFHHETGTAEVAVLQLTLSSDNDLKQTVHPKHVMPLLVPECAVIASNRKAVVEWVQDAQKAGCKV